MSPFHQLVFVPDSEPEPTWETIQRLIYRADLDAIEEHSSIGHPDEINRRPGQLAAVGSFGSVMWGIQDYVESSLIASAALTVAALACVRDIRRQALAQLSGFQTGQPDLVEARRALSWMEVELTFGAEAWATVSPLLPSLRVESYHQALFAASDVEQQTRLAAECLSGSDPSQLDDIRGPRNCGPN